MAATADHYTLMRRLLGSPPPGKRWVPCDGRYRTGAECSTFCVGALCPKCGGSGYLLKRKKKGVVR